MLTGVEQAMVNWRGGVPVMFRNALRHDGHLYKLGPCASD